MRVNKFSNENETSIFRMFSFLLHLLQISLFFLLLLLSLVVVVVVVVVFISFSINIFWNGAHNIAVNNPWLSDLHNISLAVYLIELNKKSDHHVKKRKHHRAAAAAAQHNIRAQIWWLNSVSRWNVSDFFLFVHCHLSTSFFGARELTMNESSWRQGHQMG